MTELSDIYSSRITASKSHYFRFVLYSIRSPPTGHFHLESKKNISGDVKYVSGVFEKLPGIYDFSFKVYSCNCKIKTEFDCCWFKNTPQKHMKTVTDFTKTSEKLNYMMYVNFKIREIKFSIDLKKMHNDLDIATEKSGEFYMINIMDNIFNKTETVFRLSPSIKNGKSDLLECFIKNFGSIKITYKSEPEKEYTNSDELEKFIKSMSDYRQMMNVKLGKIDYTLLF